MVLIDEEDLADLEKRQKEKLALEMQKKL